MTHEHHHHEHKHADGTDCHCEAENDEASAIDSSLRDVRRQGLYKPHCGPCSHHVLLLFGWVPNRVRCQP